MRTAGVVAWGLGVAASLLFLWFGVYRLLAPAQTDSPLCVGFDMPWFLVGVLVNLASASVALAAYRAGWWALGIAAPGLAALGIALLLPCSFVLPLALPFAALVAIGSAVVVIVRRDAA